MAIYRIRKNLEFNLQEWYALYLTGLGVLHCASCGGMRTSLGTAVKMKRAGYRKGFPDMGIFEPRGGYFGMFVELKCGAKTTDEQVEWQAELTKRGYYALIMPANLDFRESQNWLETKTMEYLKGLTQ